MALFGTGAGGSGSVLRLEVAKHCSAVVSENWNRNKKKKTKRKCIRKYAHMHILLCIRVCEIMHVHVYICMYVCV